MEFPYDEESKENDYLTEKQQRKMEKAERKIIEKVQQRFHDRFGSEC